VLLTAVATGLAGMAAAASVGADVAAAATSHRSTTTTTPSATTTTTKPLSKADQWLAKALKTEISVGSVHIDGSVKQGTKTIGFHLVVNGNGDGSGTFTQQGNTVHILRLGPLIYFKAPMAFWAKNAPPQQAQSYGGRWIELSSLDVRFQSFDQFLDAADLVAAVFQGHPRPLTVGKPTTYNGHQVVIVKEVARKNGKTSTGTMYIGTNGKAYVYRILNDTPGDVSNLVFSNYGKAIPVTVPPNAINLT
jgi:hypothetical protein